MSIRTRFTILFSIILALTLSIFGAVLYSIQDRETINSLKEEMIFSANRFSEALIKTSSRPFPPPNEERIPPLPFDKFSPEQEFQTISEREIVRILDENGNLIASPFGREGDALPLSNEGLKALQNGDEWWEIELISNESMLIYSRAVINNNQVVNFIQVARSLTERDRALRSLATTFIIVGFLTVLIAFGIGWLLSGLTLKPIQKITQTAIEIGEKNDFNQRVKYEGPNDEVGELARTFNQMLERIQAAFNKVENALEMQRNFVADVSHELRTPLTTLRGNIGLLRREPPPEIQTDILNDMVEESDRLIRLVNELLLMARAEVGRELSNDSIQISNLLIETCRYSNLIESERKIVENISPGLIITGDRDAMKQIILIGLDNALKHSEGDIFIQAKQIDSKIEISIKDQGEGISQERLQHVFDRFNRSNEEPQAPGYGLGLSIAKKLVEQQGGKITLESEIGKGSTLRITFPN